LENMSVVGLMLSTWATRQIVSGLGYAGCAAT
jgi:hypothetical protein